MTQKQTNPFGARQPSSENESETEKPSLTSIAASTSGERFNERLSAEEQAVVKAYNSYLESGEMNKHVAKFFKRLKTDFYEVHLFDQPEFKPKVAEMIASEAILCLLHDHEWMNGTGSQP